MTRTYINFSNFFTAPILHFGLVTGLTELEEPTARLSFSFCLSLLGKQLFLIFWILFRSSTIEELTNSNEMPWFDANFILYVPGMEKVRCVQSAESIVCREKATPTFLTTYAHHYDQIYSRLGAARKLPSKVLEVTMNIRKVLDFQRWLQCFLSALQAFKFVKNVIYCKQMNLHSISRSKIFEPHAVNGHKRGEEDSKFVSGSLWCLIWSLFMRIKALCLRFWKCLT